MCIGVTKATVFCDEQEYVGEIDVCVEDETVKYLNRKDVQEALHAQLVNVDRWTVCSE